MQRILTKQFVSINLDFIWHHTYLLYILTTYTIRCVHHPPGIAPECGMVEGVEAVVVGDDNVCLVF